ncbi:MAG: hypothetical protein RJA49_3055, partial [Actinomycetota bacterium]
MSDITSDVLAQAALQPRFMALSQLDMALGDVHRWDAALLREPRLLVPVDVTALVVRAGDEPMVRLPFRTGDDQAPVPDDPGAARPDGVHLMWSVPSTFGRGTLIADQAAPGDHSRRLLQLRPLPDRWVVLRLAVPVGARDPIVRGWVIEADTASITPLADWPTVRTNTVTLGPDVPPERLDVHVGGASWTSCYDAALGRLALHDPLDDLAALAPNGVVGDALNYVVGGWWSVATRDPLDGVGSIFGYHDRLEALGWDDPDHPAPAGRRYLEARSATRVARAFSLPVATRYAKSTVAAFPYSPSTSRFVGEALEVAELPESPTRSTLLHGRIHGVPWRSSKRPDDRPAASAVRCAFGPTSPSVGALLASDAVTSPATADQQRNAERLLTAFSTGLLSRIESPDVWPDIDQYEHAQGFTSTSGGVEAVDRFQDQPRPGNDPGSGFRVGRRGAIQYEELSVAANILWSSDKSALFAQSQYTAKAAGGHGVPLAKSPRSTTGAAAAASAGSQGIPLASASQSAKTSVTAASAGLTTRAVERPAPPFNTPVAPVLAVVGPGRRVLAAERDEADGLLRVRTSDQPDRGLAGVLAADELLHTIGSGAVPDEMLALTRESLAGDPYLSGW